MIFFFYNLCWFLALLVALPLLPILALFPKIRNGLGMRLGILPHDVRSGALMSQRRIWIHAASLGEINAIAAAVEVLQAKLPHAGIVITCTTMSGLEQARRRIPAATAHLLMPFDFGPCIEPFIEWFKPEMALIVETELWPNFVRLLKKHDAVVLILNARMSESSLGRYMKVRSLFAQTLKMVHTVAAQSRTDADRFVALGANPQRVQVLGNTKFDLAAVEARGRSEAEKLRKELGLDREDKVIVAGSTRPGEEDALLDIFMSLRDGRPKLKLILAPRHLERLGEVKAMARKKGFGVSTRSGLAQGREKGGEVILLDTLGELSHLYAVGHLAWIGGSWKDFGGQNPLEPAVHGIPPLFGPYMSNFREAAALLVQEKAGLQLENPRALAEASARLLDNPDQCGALGKRAAACLQVQSGASTRGAELAAKLLLISDLKKHSDGWREDSASRQPEPVEFGDSTEVNDHP